MTANTNNSHTAISPELTFDGLGINGPAYNEAQRAAMNEPDPVKRAELFKARDALKLIGNDPYNACQRLSEASHKFKECDMYLGDDGLIYLS